MQAIERVREVAPKKKLALVIDDDKVARILTKRLLAEKGYEVDLVEDGEAALIKIKERIGKLEFYNEITVDYSMAEPIESKLNGAQTIIAIRMLGGHYMSVHIDGMSSQYDEMQAETDRFFNGHPLRGSLQFFDKVERKAKLSDPGATSLPVDELFLTERDRSRSLPPTNKPSQ